MVIILKNYYVFKGYIYISIYIFFTNINNIILFDRLNLTNTGLGDGNTRLLFRAWNSPIKKPDIYHQNSLSIDDGDEESLEEDIFCDNTDNTPSLISLKLGNNKIENFGTKELAKFLKLGGCNLAEVLF